MNPSRVLVTGAAGRIGRAVVAELAGAGITAVAVDREAPEGGRIGDVPVRVADLTDPAAARDAVTGCTGVVHLAAYPAPGMAPDAELFANNTATTYHVLAAAAEAGVGTAVIASSASAYGMTYAKHRFSPLYVPIDEDHPMLPQDVYALSKVVDEETAKAFVRATDMTVVAMRFHWVAHEGPLRDMAARLTADPGREAHNLWGYIEVHDAARACRAALDVSDGFHALNICATDSLCDLPTAELVARFHPDTELREPIEGMASAWSTARARALLGFVPRWSWRGGPTG